MIFSYMDVFVNGEIQFVSVTHNIQLASLNTPAPLYSLLHSREKTIEITETAVVSILLGRFMTLVKKHIPFMSRKAQMDLQMNVCVCI